jgi:hypothetical protein
MKKLTYQDVYKLLSIDILQLPRDYGYNHKFHNTFSMLLSLEEIKEKIPQYPIENAPTIANKYVVLKSYALLMNPHQNLKKYSKLIHEWAQIEIEYSAKSTDYNIDYLEREKLGVNSKSKSLLLESALYVDLYNKDITDVDFWKYFDPYRNNNNPAGASVLAKLFETTKDVLEFQKIVGNKVSHSDIKYQTFIKALKIVPEYSLEDVPEFLTKALGTNNSETVKIDAARALKKYRFDLTKDFYIKEVQTSKRPKFNNFVEQILKENGYLEKKSFDDLLLSVDEATIYEKKVCIDFAVLKSLVNNDGLLVETLASIYTTTLKKEYRTLSFELDEKNVKIYFTATSENQDIINSFQQDLLKAIEYTYSPTYLQSNIPVNITNHSRGERIHFEKNALVVAHYLEQFNTWKLKDKLENNLHNKTTTVKRNKL